MPVPTQLSDLSATAASNSPAGGDTVGTTMDDYIRAIQSIIVRISAGTDALATPNIGAATGTSLVLSGLATVNGAFTSLGLDDNATAKALTLSGSGANSVTIANSATNPTIGTSDAGSNLFLSSATGNVGIGGTTYATSGLVVGSTGQANHVVITDSATNPTIGVSAGNLGISSAVVGTGSIQCLSTTGTPVGGQVAFYMGSAAVGIYFGSGAPSVTAARGSLYLRTDNGANTSLYVNRDGGTTWAAVTSA